jgi:KDO2-lipid IV(A) lauroyltransferase
MAWLSDRMVALLFGVVGKFSRPAQRRVAHLLARLAWTLGIRRKITLGNLRRAFPRATEEARIAVARASYESLSMSALDAFIRGDAAREFEALAVDDWRTLQGALESGRGLLIASAHFGSWERLADVMRARGYRFGVVARTLRGAWNRRILNRREGSGIEVISPRGAVFEMLEFLRGGKAVVQLIDQWLPVDRGVVVPFFGLPTSTSPALSMAALRSGAPVFMVLSVRHDGALRMFVEGPIPVPQVGSRRARVAAHCAALNTILESYVRKFPDQWLWMHRRWKNLDASDAQPEHDAGLHERRISEGL